VTLFTDPKVPGTFYGFSGRGLVPAADLIFQHDPNYPHIPVVGRPVLVRLDRDDEALLVRITHLSPEGSLASAVGNEYVMRNLRQAKYDIPEDLRRTKLIYRVQGRPLGVLRAHPGEPIQFVPSHRRIPPFGSPVMFADDELFQVAMNAADSDRGVPIGHAALGEFVWCSPSDVDETDRSAQWVVTQKPVTQPKFDISQLVARRSFVLAKAGYGKSNLVKLLFSELYSDGVPNHRWNDGSISPVGVLVGDLDGEYFWPTAENPGLADIEHLHNHLVVFTERTHMANSNYNAFTAGQVKLDIREISPAKLLPLVLPRERLSMSNVTQLMELGIDRWRDLVDTIVDSAGELNTEQRNQLNRILRLDNTRNPAVADNIVDAAVRNTRQVIGALHNPTSTLLSDVLDALREGKLVVLDLSQFRPRAQALLGILLSRIFDHNMERFTHGNANMIPVIVVIEEAQNVLNGRETEVTRPFIEFTKEGRKFGCGIFGITQQPGAIDDEIMSQGDNFFAFHLLSEGDLKALSRANPHFSEDLLSGLLNEPLVGSGLFFSLYSSKQYPIPFRPFDFAKRNPRRLAQNADLSTIYAAELRKRAQQRLASAEPDKYRAIEQAVLMLSKDRLFLDRCRRGEAKPGRVQIMLANHAPKHILDEDDPNAGGNERFKQPSARWASGLIDSALDRLFPPKEGGWEYIGTDRFRRTICAPRREADTDTSNEYEPPWFDEPPMYPEEPPPF